MNMKYVLRSEDTEQISVIQWAEWNTGRYPELKWLHHCPNGGSRNKQEAVKLKQMGVKAGVSDLCLPYPKGTYCGLYIEMKYGNKAAVAERVPCRHGGSRAFCCNLLFSKRCNCAHRGISASRACRGGSELFRPNNSIFKEGKVI